MKAKGFVECTVGIILLPLLCLLFDGILLCAAVYPALQWMKPVFPFKTAGIRSKTARYPGKNDVCQGNYCVFRLFSAGVLPFQF